MICRRRH